MAVTLWSAEQHVDTNAGNHTAALGSNPRVGDLMFIAVMATDNTGTFGCTDDNPDGLGAYTKVTDSFRAGGIHQVTLLVRNSLFGAASATNVTTTGVGAGSSGGGFYAVSWGGVGKAGLSAIRQFSQADNVASGVIPTMDFALPMLPGNACTSIASADSAGALNSFGAPWSSSIPGSYVTPSFVCRAYDLAPLVGWVGKTVTYPNNPTGTMSGITVELDLVSPALIAYPNMSHFPKGSES